MVFPLFLAPAFCPGFFISPAAEVRAVRGGGNQGDAGAGTSVAQQRTRHGRWGPNDDPGAQRSGRCGTRWGGGAPVLSRGLVGELPSFDRRAGAIGDRSGKRQLLPEPVLHESGFGANAFPAPHGCAEAPLASARASAHRLRHPLLLQASIHRGIETYPHE